MARNFQRPENALRRAEEFMDVDKPSRALDTLYDFIKSKRLRSSNYSEKVLEPIMMKYLTLCVELKRSHIAKEGLYQYRNICQTVNIASLEKVVREYLAMAEKRTESAREASQQAVIDIDDLDNVASPESLLLSAVSGEDVQDRTDRAILTPWVRFLWESYRQCLELLRINPRLERLYHDIAQMAFKFCLKYGRKTEFRKLCDSLRTHLSAIVKQQAAGTGQIHLTNVETLAMNSETRLAQLESAIQMELWQEAYKAIEDINGLMVLSKKMPRPQMLANYYQKLALVFWKGGNMLFHAATLFRLFHLSRDMKKNISATELSKMAGQVVMATLGVALPSLHPEFDRFIETEKSSIEKTQRLANLLNLPSPPTRQGLVRDLVRLGVLPYAPAALQRLYHVLEADFNPLTMCKEVGTIVGDIAGNDDCKHLAQYCEPVQNMALVHLMKQVAQVYQTIDFERLLKLASFTTAFHLQRIIVDLVRHNDMQIRIDHMKHSVHFGVGFAERAESEMKEGGVTIQPMPSDQIRFQLMDMARALEEAYQMIEPDKIRQERQDLKKAIHRTYHSFKERDHRRMLMRQQIIEDRKELMETLSQQRAEEERRAQEEVLERHRRAEEERLAREMREREERRKLTEMEAIKERQREERVKMLTQTAVGAKVLASLNEKDLESIDADLLMQRQVEELEKERQELQSKMKNQLKKVDHFERAKRLEEVPLLKKAYEDRRAQDKEFWEKEELERIELAKKEREYGLATRQRLERIQDDYHEFMSKLRAERDAQYDEKMNEFQTMLDAERNVRLEKRKQERKEQRRVEYEEEMKRKAEEEEKKKLEQVREKARKEREEMDRLTKERMKREEEVEQKRKTELEEQMRAAPRADDRRGGAAAPSREKDWRRGPETGGDKNDSTCGAPKVGWRDRVKLKEEEWGPSKRGDERSRDEPTARDGPRSWRTEPRDEPSSRGVNRDERRGPREDRPPIRDEGFRRGPPRDDSDRDADVRRGPPREEREEPRREERGPPAAEDRAPAVGGAGKYVPPINRRGGAGPRDDADRDRDTRDRPGPGPRDFGDRDRDRDMPPRRGADEGPWRRGGDRMDGPSPRDRDRDMGPRGGDGPRGGGGGGGGPWRRGGDDRGPPRGGDDRGPRGPPRGGDDWGRRAGDDRDKEEPRKDGPWRPRPRGDDGPRRAD